MVFGREKNVIVSIHQPSYFPWLGLLNKIDSSDIFVLMDDVQLTDRAFQHRNIFLSNNGQKHMLTIPIDKKNYRNKSIKELMISGDDWQKNHKRFLVDNYKKYPFFEEIYSQIDFIFSKKYIFLLDVLMDSMISILNMFSIDTQIILQSNLDYDKNIQKEELIVGILKSLNSDSITYLSGIGAKVYQEKKNFSKEGIELTYQDFDHPIYNQYKNKNDFIAGLSALDILFNIGIEESKKVTKSIK